MTAANRPATPRLFVSVWFLVAKLVVAVVARAEVGTGTRGIVSSTHPLATEAGLAVLKNGGNAIDAAVAVGLTLGVVDGYNSGIGGGCFMLIRRADGKVIALDGRETAPAAATRDMYIRNGKADTTLSQTGALASGVPGALATYAQAVRDHGRKPLGELITPAAQIAENGFRISGIYARRIKSTATQLQRFPSPRAIFFRPDGQPLAEGDLLKQTDLGRSYRAIAKEGMDWFYRGAYATAVDAWMREHQGTLTAVDFRNYVVKARTPITTTYR
jgi:gamma-glutamyltranspeptidase/glutathione hydrolase